MFHLPAEGFPAPVVRLWGRRAAEEQQRTGLCLAVAGGGPGVLHSHEARRHAHAVALLRSRRGTRQARLDLLLRKNARCARAGPGRPRLLLVLQGAGNPGEVLPPENLRAGGARGGARSATGRQPPCPSRLRRRSDPASPPRSRPRRAWFLLRQIPGCALAIPKYPAKSSEMSLSSSGSLRYGFHLAWRPPGAAAAHGLLAARTGARRAAPRAMLVPTGGAAHLRGDGALAVDERNDARGPALQGGYEADVRYAPAVSDEHLRHGSRGVRGAPGVGFAPNRVRTRREAGRGGSTQRERLKSSAHQYGTVSPRDARPGSASEGNVVA